MDLLSPMATRLDPKFPVGFFWASIPSISTQSPRTASYDVLSSYVSIRLPPHPQHNIRQPCNPLSEPPAMSLRLPHIPHLMRRISLGIRSALGNNLIFPQNPVQFGHPKAKPIPKYFDSTATQWACLGQKTELFLSQAAVLVYGSAWGPGGGGTGIDVFWVFDGASAERGFCGGRSGDEDGSGC